MKPVPLDRLPSYSHSSPSEAFNVLTLCDDLETARIAWRAFEAIQREWEGIHFRHELVFFEILRHPRLVESALLEIGAPDFVLICFRNDRPCPPKAGMFIREWAAHMNQHRALGVMEVTDNPEHEMDRANLQQPKENSCANRIEQLSTCGTTPVTLKIFCAVPPHAIFHRNSMYRIHPPDSQAGEMMELFLAESGSQMISNRRNGGKTVTAALAGTRLP